MLISILVGLLWLIVLVVLVVLFIWPGLVIVACSRIMDRMTGR